MIKGISILVQIFYPLFLNFVLHSEKTFSKSTKLDYYFELCAFIMKMTSVAQNYNSTHITHLCALRG